MTISVVIPTYNVVELLQKNLPYVLEALKHYDKDKVELIVTDNHSSDTSIAFLKKFQKEAAIPVVVLENSFNGGFAVNVNRGIKVAKGDIVILLGTDVRPHKDFIKPLLSHFIDKNVFAVGCANESDEDAGTGILRGRGIGKWKQGFLLHSYGDLTSDDTLWVDCGSGAFRRSLLQTVGSLEELYAPFYWEDVDLSYRAWKMGYSVKIEKSAKVIHEHKQGSIKKTAKSDQVLITAYRNQFFFVWLNISDLDLIVSHLFFLPYHLLTALKNRNWLFIRGFFNACSQLRRVMRERKNIRSKFIVSDKTILNRFASEV